MMLHNVLADSRGICGPLPRGATDEGSQLHVDVLRGVLYIRTSSLPGSNARPSYFPPRFSHVFLILRA